MIFNNNWSLTIQYYYWTWDLETWSEVEIEGISKLHYRIMMLLNSSTDISNLLKASFL